LAVEVAADERSLGVSGSFADFVWGVPEQERPAYPAVALALKNVNGLDNIVVERKPIDGVASGADIEKGDVILSVDGRNFSDINEMRTYLAGVPWDEEAKFRLLRDGEARELTIKFEFKPAEMKEGEKKTPGDKMKASSRWPRARWVLRSGISSPGRVWRSTPEAGFPWPAPSSCPCWSRSWPRSKRGSYLSKTRSASRRPNNT
jgi:membrane-associated protease RseP (regulator of RpoE activity)